jgi:hypothetical protein
LLDWSHAPCRVLPIQLSFAESKAFHLVSTQSKGKHTLFLDTTGIWRTYCTQHSFHLSHKKASYVHQTKRVNDFIYFVHDCIISSGSLELEVYISWEEGQGRERKARWWSVDSNVQVVKLDSA